jgi:hypothetical protein
MKIKSWLGLAAILASSSIATTAEARGGGVWGYSQYLEYVADFGPAGEADSLSLCHLGTKYHVLFIPVFYQSERYVLAENRCDTESFYDLQEGGLAAAQAEGLIPADIPAEPSISLEKRIPTIILGLLIAAFVVVALKRMRRQRQFTAQMSDLPPKTQRLLSILCHAAKADGEVSASEVTRIGEILKMLTGTSVAASRIEQMAQMAEKKLTPRDFNKFADGLSVDDKELAIKAVLLVCSADNSVGRAEKGFISSLASAFKVTQIQFQRIVSELQGETTS